jgi:DUF4097 and DUF4098 domain-containing protein YvlB
MRSEVFSTPGEVTLSLRVPAGEVELETSSVSETTVEFEARSGDRDVEEAARIELRDRRGRAEVVVEAPRRMLGREEYRVRITAPEGAHVDASTASADLEGRGRFGEVEVAAASGDVAFQNVGGDLKVKTASGDVAVDAVTGATSVQTASGDVALGRLAAEGAIRAASGDVTVRETAASLTVQTASGDQSIGSIASGDVRLQSASGDVSVGIRRGSRLWVDAKSMSGETSSELDVGDTPQEGEGPVVELRATTMSGDIRIARAPATEAAV